MWWAFRKCSKIETSFAALESILYEYDEIVVSFQKDTLQLHMCRFIYGFPWMHFHVPQKPQFNYVSASPLFL